MTDASLTPRQAGLIDELFVGLSGTFEEQRRQCLVIKDAALSAMAKSLEQSMNEYLAQARQFTLDERRELAAELNRCLSECSLAIRCPRTGRPAILVVDTLSADQPDVSRFRLQVRTVGGSRRTATWPTLQLPLELMPAGERIEGFRRGSEPQGPIHRA
jgi:hypothetical protein